MNDPSASQDTDVKVAIYALTAERGMPPSHADVAQRLGAAPAEVREAFRRLAGRRLLLLARDGETIRMAPPFSGVPTQHLVTAGGVSYFANCAWDALGIPAALGKPAVVDSRCEQSKQPFHLQITPSGPEASDWLFHCAVPAAHWWDDIAFT